MTASHTLARSPILGQISKHGILVMSGFGLRLKVQNGHLSAEWGIGEERHNVCLPRVNRNLRRVIIIGSRGRKTRERAAGKPRRSSCAFNPPDRVEH